MNWIESHRADRRALPIADRHYNRQKPGTDQFVPPGRCVVLLTRELDALWVSSWPFAEYVKHAWPGAWICSCFRKEGGGTASEMIRDAIAATRYYWPVPKEGMVTFINRDEVKPIMRRGKPHWGYTYEKAGFELVGETKKDRLLAFLLLPENFPAAQRPFTRQKELSFVA